MKNKPDTTGLKPYLNAQLDIGGALIPLHKPFAKKTFQGKNGVRIKPLGKAPIHPNWTKREYDSAETVREHGGKRNIGWRIPTGVVVVDVDKRHGGLRGLKKLRDKLGLDLKKYPRVKTGADGLHIFMRVPEGFAMVGSLPDFEGVEYKGIGFQVVAAGSVHPDTGKHYCWAEGYPALADAPLAPQALLDLIEKTIPEGKDAEPGQLDADQLEAMLKHLNAEDYDGNANWLPLAMSVNHAVNADEAARDVFIKWCESDPAYADCENEIVARWNSFDPLRPGGIKIGSFIRELKKHGCPDELIPPMPTSSPDDDFSDEGLQEMIANLPDADVDNHGMKISDDIETESESESEGTDENDKSENIAGLTIIRASDIKMREYEWLWPNRFAIGNLHALFGLPNQGKGMIMCEIASIVSRGAAWPDQSGNAPKAKCVILTAEESDLERTLGPRLAASGADSSQVFIMRATVTETKTQKAKRKKTKGKSKPATVFNIGTDLKRLSHIVKRHPDIRVLFIDPIGAFIGGGKQTDSYKSAEVRAVLTPITEWADRRRICVIYISHANKSGTGRALSRMTDSQAFGAAPRFVWIVGPDPLMPDSGQKVFASAKANIAKEVSALSFRIDDSEIKIDGKRSTRGKVHWIGESNVTADQVVAPPSQERPTATDAAQTFLTDLIEKHGPMKEGDIQKKAEGLYSERTLMRAKKILGITSKKELGVINGPWIWDFPYIEPEIEPDAES